MIKKRDQLKRILLLANISFLLLFLNGSFITSSSQTIDILLKGGHVIDPKNNIDGKMDIAIGDGKIVQVSKDIPVKNAKRVIDVTGLYVTPGLIDMHVHAFHGTNPESYIADGWDALPPDGFTFRAGVTTIVDAGSAGWRNFRAFKKQTIDRSRTRILAFLNIAGTGMHGRFEEQDVTDMNPEMAAYMITRLFPDILVGVKSAHYWGPDFTQVDQAVKAGTIANVPVMVDLGEHHPPLSIEELFMKHLRPGDIWTHTYANAPKDREVPVDENGKVKPFIFEAQKRGIIFDVGHGGGAFHFAQAVPSIQQGFVADVISSDLHTGSMNGGMKDMTNLLSKFMAMGLSLQDVILRSTWNPAKVINRPELGNLSVGTVADVAVFSLRKGDFGFTDVRAKKFNGTQKLECEVTFREGRVVWDLNGTASLMWDAK
ncbi:MAG: dihydroorotase [Bacteroidetes bacterium GWF2_41_9]|nr:MAG: dihydroorotase [Bacteroidetes bacterium GWA2_40_15]OFX94845.1 MAG: dihydroorotase [Bacteroidetes bacterium GWC2_40_22]OFY60178.1 MAG: dihydroorotase [Bacteroidetes bacterium GWF2_41_9]HAM10666.1 amidohydrolase/deacetylase family metallohydrolase [Bacteroidales bacterium]HBH85248.1 amidohydrolase/deacetylase family metallohydrolase [Bacteroidales bacterium]